MIEDSNTDTTNENQEDYSSYWNEAVSVRVDGKAPPEEKKAAPEEKNEVEAPVKNGEDKSEDMEGEEIKEEDESAEDLDEDGDQEEESKDESGDEDEPDPWEGVPANIREEFEKERTAREKFEHEARSNRGRLGALQREINELSRKLEQLTANPRKNEKEEPPQDIGDSIFDFPEWKQFEDDFGDVAKPQKAAMRRLYETLHSRLEDTDKVSKELKKNHDQQHLLDQAAKLEKERPGWRDFIEENREDFDAFVASDDAAKDLLEPNKEHLTNASKARALIDLFKGYLSETKPEKVESKPKQTDVKQQAPRPMPPKRKQQLKSAATVAPRSHPAPGRRSDDLPDPDAYEDAWNFFAAKAETR